MKESASLLLRTLGACILCLLQKLKASVSSCGQPIRKVENRVLLQVYTESWMCCACPAEKHQGEETDVADSGVFGNKELPLGSQIVWELGPARTLAAFGFHTLERLRSG